MIGSSLLFQVTPRDDGPPELHQKVTRGSRSGLWKGSGDKSSVVFGEGKRFPYTQGGRHRQEPLKFGTGDGCQVFPFFYFVLSGDLAFGVQDVGGGFCCKPGMREFTKMGAV